MNDTTTLMPSRDERTRAQYVTLAEYDSYGKAQQHVDALSDSGFPVKRTQIVGHDLTMVEQVTGRMTAGRAALYGAGGGAWVGLLIGLLLGLFTVGPAWVTLMVTAIVLGAAWGSLLGFLSHWAYDGRRDFASARTLRGERYTVEVEAAHAAEAARLSP